MFAEKVLLSFLVTLNSHHPCTFTSPLQQILQHSHRTSRNCYSVETLSIQMVFKPVIAWNRMFRGMLIWLFVSVKFIRSFLKFSFKQLYSNESPSKLNFTGKNIPFPSTGNITVTLFEMYSLLFFSFTHCFNNIVKPKC